MAGNPNVRLRFVNRPENVLLVRQALNGLADALGLDALELNDITTAVTEACNNVVVHAYGGEEGPLEVEFSTPAPGLDVLVRDRGIGIRPTSGPPRRQASGGIGLPVIHALAERVQLRNIEGGGTEVEMHFATAAGLGLGAPAEMACACSRGEHGAPLPSRPAASADTALMTVAPAPVAESVLPRVLSALAARAFFPSDRISDAQTLAHALLEHIDGSAHAGHLTIEISVAPHNLELRIGPLESGRAGELFAAEQPATADADLASLFERLGVGHEVARADACSGGGPSAGAPGTAGSRSAGAQGEMLALRLAAGNRRS